MKKITSGLLILLALAFIVTTAFVWRNSQTGDLRGSWKFSGDTAEEVLLFMDGYFSHTAYDNAKKKFYYTRGGTYQHKNGELVVNMEFNSNNPEEVGRTFTYKTTFSGNQLTANINSRNNKWTQIDNGANALHGVWQITGRKQGDNIVPMNPGPRKTIKILTQKRFQWVAINPATKGFFGTGGGTYSFTDGKYQETIEFFSRDSSRVGAMLQFEGKVNDRKWTHQGLSSRGDPIHEIWERKTPAD